MKDGDIDQVVITIQHPGSGEPPPGGGRHHGRKDPGAERSTGERLDQRAAQQRPIREVRIDPLGRAPISLDDAPLEERFAGKRVLVTGAAGSIGSEIARQLLNGACSEAVLLDNAGGARSTTWKWNCARRDDRPRPEILSRGHSGPSSAMCRTARRWPACFAEVRPEIVFHAAAYKACATDGSAARPGRAHQRDGHASHRGPVLRERGRGMRAGEHRQAVNPTSVMGASKRVAEPAGPVARWFRRASSPRASGTCSAATVRAIPLLPKQIRRRRTGHRDRPEVTRFFMTIPEACRLVLEAGAMGRGRYVFDMGAPVRII